jgi:hypothetical protein
LYVGSILILLFIPRRLPAVATALDPTSSIVTFLMGLTPVNTQAGDTRLLTVEDRGRFLTNLALSSSAPTFQERAMAEEWRTSMIEFRDDPQTRRPAYNMEASAFMFNVTIGAVMAVRRIVRIRRES